MSIRIGKGIRRYKPFLPADGSLVAYWKANRVLEAEAYASSPHSIDVAALIGPQWPDYSSIQVLYNDSGDYGLTPDLGDMHSNNDEPSNGSDGGAAQSNNGDVHADGGLSPIPEEGSEVESNLVYFQAPPRNDAAAERGTPAKSRHGHWQ